MTLFPVSFLTFDPDVGINIHFAGRDMVQLVRLYLLFLIKFDCIPWLTVFRDYVTVPNRDGLTEQSVCFTRKFAWRKGVHAAKQRAKPTWTKMVSLFRTRKLLWLNG